MSAAYSWRKREGGSGQGERERGKVGVKCNSSQRIGPKGVRAMGAI